MKYNNNYLAKSELKIKDMDIECQEFITNPNILGILKHNSKKI